MQPTAANAMVAEESSIRVPIIGGFCKNRCVSQTLPKPLEERGMSEKSWRVVSKELTSPIARYFLDNYIFIGGALICSIPMLILAVVFAFWPVYLILVAVWTIYAAFLLYQERVSIPALLRQKLGELNGRFFAPMSLEMSYVPGACYGYGHFLLTPVAVADAAATA